MSEFALRSGTERDIAAMHRLDVLCFEPPFQFDLRAMRSFALEPGAFSVVAERGSELGGFIIVSMWRRRRFAGLAYVMTLDVNPGIRRRGLARSLIAEAERRAANEGAEALLLHVYAGNIVAIAFYEAAGYSSVELIEDLYGPGLHGWLYRKALPISLA